MEKLTKAGSEFGRDPGFRGVIGGDPLAEKNKLGHQAKPGNPSWKVYGVLFDTLHPPRS